MYRKQIRRRRAALAVLVAASIALITVTFGGRTGFVDSVGRGVSAVVAPIEEGASRALKPVRDLIDWIGDTADAKGENERLREEVAELRNRLSEAEDSAAENVELREMVGLAERPEFPSGYDPVAARVIARSPSVWYQAITIDKGSGSGVEVDDAVVTGDGLVGRVESVTGGSAVVRLISHPDSRVSAVIAPRGEDSDTRVGGILAPRVGDPEDMLVEFIERGRRIREGWLVSTAGWRSGDLESLFPPGIPIGRVTKADAAEQETYQRVHIEPFAKLRSLTVVLVLTGGANAAREERVEAGGAP